MRPDLGLLGSSGVSVAGVCEGKPPPGGGNGVGWAWATTLPKMHATRNAFVIRETTAGEITRTGENEFRWKRHSLPTRMRQPRRNYHAQLTHLVLQRKGVLGKKRRFLFSVFRLLFVIRRYEVAFWAIFAQNADFAQLLAECLNPSFHQTSLTRKTLFGYLSYRFRVVIS